MSSPASSPQLSEMRILVRRKMLWTIVEAFLTMLLIGALGYTAHAIRSQNQENSHG